MSKMKRFFNTYKKATLSTLCAAAILLLLGTSMVYAAGAVAESSAIGSNNAQNFAFADAGIDPVSAQMVRTEFDHELGRFVYEVEFIFDGTEYEYWIDASDGTILKKEIEMKEAERKPEPKPVPTAQPEAKTELAVQPATQPAQVGLEAAKNTALADAGLSVDHVTFIKAQLDYDDGIQVYDIEFISATHEYDYEINAATGAVHDKSIEALEVRENPPAGGGNTTPDNTSDISLDRAKEIAVAKAGLSVSDVMFTKAKLEHDDGHTVYEIEYYHNGMEYECTVKAADGAVLEYDYEREDD